ncbi:MAG TPA: glycosyltransferase [Oligoflexia bacterium]|nr:glycosyltransferase [Oligoflexia bacterium]HMP49043.1 glycosyltransferase [Oligoflexia bacterium]
MAHGEIFILNYGYADFLKPCLKSVFENQIQAHTFGVTVIDNGSLKFNPWSLKRDFPELSIISLKKNLGFSKGNNIGITNRLSEIIRNGEKYPDFIVLLNNDTLVDSRWFETAAETLTNEPMCGICGSRTSFMDRFIVIDIHSPAYHPTEHGSNDIRRLGVFMSRIPDGNGVIDDQHRFKFEGCYEPQGDGRWLSPEARLFIPIIETAGYIKVHLTLENHNAGLNHLPVRISSPDSGFPPLETLIERDQPKTLKLNLDRENAKKILQNAGSVIYLDYSAGDRGFLEIDKGQYSVMEDVDAVCGVSMFIKTEVWKMLGGFDETYFSYYEDTDFCVRARLAGYRSLYQPLSQLTHLHAGTSKEHSREFKQTVKNSKLVFQSKTMKPDHWKKTISKIKIEGRNEFYYWIITRTLPEDSNLKTLVFYYKNYLRFKINRIRARLEAPWKTLSIRGDRVD